MRLIRDHVAKSENCLFVSAGPSSEHFRECLGFGHVATVNRMALIVPGTIDLACADDFEVLEWIKPAWDRICRFSVPDGLSVGGKVTARSWAEWPGAPYHRALIFPHSPMDVEFEQVTRSVNDPNRLATCNSACQGLTAMGRLGYKRVWVLGCDGGTGRSPFLPGNPDKPAIDFTGIRERMQLIAKLIGERHGTVVKFWPERF